MRFWAEDAAARVAATLRGRAVRAYWYRGRVNFGDLVTPFLLRRLGRSPLHAPPASADLICTGSILQWTPTDFRGVILGAGLIRAEEARRFPQAEILAVRGPLTREHIGAAADVALGDPGLLVARWLPSREAKTHALGVVPHYEDRGDPRLARILRQHAGAVRLIDVQRPPLRVFRDIDRCSGILSSSLHGIIAADALGIPCAWLVLSDRVAGGEFKFRDYHASIDLEAQPHALEGTESLEQLVARTRRAPAELVRGLQDGLQRAFRAWTEADR